MAERKSGPVKPPVIDLKAKPARSRTASSGAQGPSDVTEAAAETEASRPSPTPPPPPPPRPQARLAMPWSAISIATIAGGLLGTLLTYLAVTYLPLPDNRPVIADPGARLEAQDRAIAELTTRLAAAEQVSRSTEDNVLQTISSVGSDVQTLRQQLAAIPAPAPVDIAPVEQKIAELESRIAAIGAGASGADATALAESMTGLETGLGELRASVEALVQRTTDAEQSIAQLGGEVEAAKLAAPAQAPANDNIGPAVRLPLMVSGLESAFANGRPYAAELAALTGLVPEIKVPESIAVAAAAGLPRPDAVAARFSEIVPDMLAHRAALGSGDLGQDALDWAKGLLAIRPVDEVEGASPEAVVSRLEAAVARRDFITAAGLLDQLPAPMHAAAGPVAIDIRTLAAADGVVAALRALALQPEAVGATP